MDAHAANLLALLKKPAASSDAKVKELNQLKSDIKHYRVPENAVASVFECIRLSISQQASSTLASTAFSTLGHLLKRLKIQDASGHVIAQFAPRLFPSLQERLGDLREPVRAAASQALTDLYPFCGSDVESIIQEEAIGSSNARAKETGMRWVVRMHKEEGMPFKTYVSSIVARLEDADGNVREAGKSVLIELFSTAPERAKLDLKRQLKAHSVRHSIASQILSQIGAEETSRPQTANKPAPSPELTASTRSLPSLDNAAHFAQSIQSEAAQPPPPEEEPMDPIYVHVQRDLEDEFRDMLPFFEGKETEENWKPRQNSIIKLRRILKGNAPTEFHTAFMVGLKSMIEGIIKVSISLRTTMATKGCLLVQELARTLGPAMDPHVEMFLQTFIKMSANRKHIAAENGKTTADAIFQNCSYNVRMMQHIWLAMQEKNVEQRQATPDWLSTILRRQASYKHNFESSGGLELAEKCIKKGLDDANPKVKEGYRATYWTFAKNWPDKANAIMAKLDPKSKTALEKDSHNPNAAMFASVSSTAASSAAPSRAGAASRSNLREHMAEQRRAKAAGGLPSRPNSAMADISPVKSRQPVGAGSRGPSNLSKVTNRNVSTTSNASAAPEAPGSSSTAKKSSLMSGPVRRPRRPEIQRPQTADPYASRRMLRPETPANDTPLGSPQKGTGASKASMASSVAGRSGTRTGIPTVSPGGSGSPLRRSPVLIRGKPQPDGSSRPTSKGSIATNGEAIGATQEDDLTMVIPRGSVNSRAAFSPGHKRPGQTMSVDSGRNAFADEDDGFTMVMPDLSAAQSRARSPLAQRTPMKAMFEEAREKVGKLSPEAEKHMRTHSNDLDNIVEAPLPQSAMSQPADVQIYEDPFTESAAQPGAVEERKVLGELPVNENMRLHSPTQSANSSNSPAGSPNQPADSRMQILSPPRDRPETARNRKLLESGISRIRTKTLDAHGFRKVQDVVKSKTDIWDGGRKYDELMAVVLEYLRTFDDDPKLNQQHPGKSAGLKTQAYGLVRALLTLYRKDAMAWHAKALVTVLVCRASAESASFLLVDMHRTADDIVREAAPGGCVDAVLDFLSSLPENSPRVVAMALVILRQLVMSAKTKEVDLGTERKSRLAHATAQYLNDVDSEVRKVDVDLASELFDVFGTSKTEFWTEFKGVDENRLSLLTYYIAKKGGAAVQ